MSHTEKDTSLPSLRTGLPSTTAMHPQQDMMEMINQFVADQLVLSHAHSLHEGLPSAGQSAVHNDVAPQHASSAGGNTPSSPNRLRPYSDFQALLPVNDESQASPLQNENNRGSNSRVPPSLASEQDSSFGYPPTILPPFFAALDHTTSHQGSSTAEQVMSHQPHSVTSWPSETPFPPSPFQNDGALLMDFPGGNTFTPTIVGVESPTFFSHNTTLPYYNSGYIPSYLSPDAASPVRDAIHDPDGMALVSSSQEMQDKPRPEVRRRHDITANRRTATAPYVCSKCMLEVDFMTSGGRKSACI
ncbi:hypothetical protein BDZ89DRAFT_829318 [Hymenopellis radicata]|nr:hypothetical protein BDZ89DRAFT_829318 [Hymenopellis radicata]